MTSLHLTSINEKLQMTSNFERDNGSATRIQTHSADEDHHETRPIAPRGSSLEKKTEENIILVILINTDNLEKQ